MDKYLETFAAIPWLEVLLAAIAMQVMSTIWYAVLFAKTHQALSNIPEESCDGSPSPLTMLKGFLAFFATCSLIGLVDVHAQGNAFAIFASLGFVWMFISFDMIHACIWEKMPLKLFLIYAGNTLTNFVVAGLVFWLI